MGGLVDEAPRPSRMGATSSRDGAEILHVGGESTRPAAEPSPSASEEAAPASPVSTGARPRPRAGLGRHVEPAVAAAGARRGATYVIDVTVFRADPT